MKAKGSTNPRLTEPKQPSMQRKAFHHDYRRPARYLITIAKSPAIPPLATIQGDPRCTDPSEAAHPPTPPQPPRPPPPTRQRHNPGPPLPPHRPGTPLPLFSKGFNDSIAYHDDQYRRQLKYVADNPRRLLLKRLHPDLFFRKWEITIGDLRLTASGNIFLLHSPSMINVRFSRRYTPQQWHDIKERYLA